MRFWVDVGLDTCDSVGWVKKFVKEVGAIGW